MMASARTQRLAAYETVRAALTSARARRFLNRMETWVAGRGWLNSETLETQQTLDDWIDAFSRRHINRRVAHVRKVYGDFEALSVDQRHDLRKDVKKIRYGLEFFAAALPKGKSTRLSSVLKGLQDALGHLNDIDVADRTISALMAHESDVEAKRDIENACAAIRKLHRNAAKKAHPRAGKLWQRFLKLPKY